MSRKRNKQKKVTQAPIEQEISGELVGMERLEEVREGRQMNDEVQRQREDEVDQGEPTKKTQRECSWKWCLAGVVAVFLVLTTGAAMWSALGRRVLDAGEVIARADEAETPGDGEVNEEESPKEEPPKEKPSDTETPEEPEQPSQQIVDRPKDEVELPAVTPGSRVIALTFDDGPSAATTPRLLDILKGRNVKATFFVLGTLAERNPDIIKREAAEGHEIASHTPYHNQLTNLTYAQVRAEAVEMDRIFTEILGVVPPFTRPPYGAYNATVQDALHQPLITWSIDPRDWADRNSDIVCNRVISAAFDGAIILVHDIHATTVDAVPCIVDNLRKQGYEFLTVSELAAMKNVPLVNGGVYGSF